MKRSEARSSSSEPRTRLRELTADLKRLEAKLRRGGGPEKIEKQHKQGKLTARERIDLLLDKNSYAQEIGLLIAYDQYKTEVRGQRSEVREVRGQRSEVRGQKSGVNKESEEVGAAPAAGVVTTI